MEDILGVYKGAYDVAHPLICMDESSKQQIKEVRQPLPASPGSIEKYDTEYERNGVSNLFMFFEPLAGQRHVAVTDRRTAVDWAHQIKRLVDDLYPQAERITLECKRNALKDFVTSICGPSIVNPKGGSRSLIDKGGERAAQF